MPTCTAEFRTDADYATRAFQARSPRDALRQARAFYDDRTEELIFDSYDGRHPVTDITVRDAKGHEVALWHHDELRLRLAAGDTLEALELCVDCLADLARLDDGTSSISALNQARAAITRAKGKAASLTDNREQLPPDPKKKNGGRTEWAAAALRQYQRATGCDCDDSLCDLLCDLMHWSDGNNFDFETALCRACGHYEAETAGGAS